MRFGGRWPGSGLHNKRAMLGRAWHGMGSSNGAGTTWCYQLAGIPHWLGLVGAQTYDLGLLAN